MMYRPLRALLLVACLWAASGAQAVVISTGDGSGNTSAPPDDPGFANVGTSSTGLSGVYLGNRWVLTARHVGQPTHFTFDGISYPTVSGSRVVLSVGGQLADVAMHRLAGPAPPLPDLVIASAPIAVGEVATLVGNGWSRAPALTCWNGAWSEVSCPAGSFEGYERLGAKVLRWGRNEVTAVGEVLAGSGISTVTFAMVFDADPHGEPDEGQLVTGDSGGAAFVKRGGVWELVGIHVAMSVFSGQPTKTAVFGNESLSADVHHYRDEIEALLAIPRKIPLLPWPALLLAGALLLGAARTALVGRR